jgi:hypothetical protein
MKVKEAIEILSKLDENTTIDQNGIEINGYKLFALPQTSVAIIWSVEDFEMQARNTADDEWEDEYDQAKFTDALHRMIENHDADCGITWSTVSDYLIECKR